MQKMFRNYGKIFDLRVNIPESHELEQLVQQIDVRKLEAFVDVCFPHLTDRSISFAPSLIAGVGVVFELGVNKAMVKTADLLVNKDVANQLSKAIEPQVITDIRSKIELIESLQDYDQIQQVIEEIKADAKVAAQSQKVTKEDLMELHSEVKKVLSNNKAWKAGETGVPDAVRNAAAGNMPESADQAQSVTQP
jgi:hypothetical protein